ncbi:MAG: hypothetical protein H0T56_02595, partial [Pseudaminobacter sp.]|nr:hypothetical protein [Pseudaminobacter sp.]
LKTFIKADKGEDKAKIKGDEIKRLSRCFSFLDVSYAETKLGDTNLARDLVHFYTMVTVLLSSSLLDAEGAPPNYPGVRAKLLAFATLLPEDAPVPKDQKIADALADYRQAATRQTTHPGRRATRHKKLLEILEAL